MYSRSSRHSFAFLLTCCTALVACTDRHPAGVPETSEPEPPAEAVATMTCTVTVQGGTLACDGAAAGRGTSAAIIGGQGVYVRLTAFGGGYDAATGTLHTYVTVENLTPQALGTTDGITPSADGVRVFFNRGPVATRGEGMVSVANADGQEAFLAAEQKYFQYDGILAPGDTSVAKEWRFTVEPGVGAFSFGVYVAAPVRAEEGYLSMMPLAPAVAVGDTQRVTPTVRNMAGGVVADQPVAWTTSNPAVATVDAQGLVTGLAAGTATVTATSGGRTGSVEVLVYTLTSEALRPPAFLVFRVEGASLTAGSRADSVKLRLEYRGTGGFSPYLRVMLRHASGIQRECVSHTGFGWVGDNPEMWCGGGMPDGILGGVWRVERIEFSGRSIPHAALLAAGAPAHVYVSSPNEDRTAPTVDSVWITPRTVDGGAYGSWIAAQSVDDHIGTEQMHAYISSPGNHRISMPGQPITEENRRRLFYFEFAVPRYFPSGTFVLDSLRVTDYNGNRRAVSRAELTAAGFATTFEVSGTTPDTIAPRVAAFSFSPQTVAGNGSDQVSVTFTATEPASESGVWFMDLLFEKVSNTSETRRCLVNGTSVQHTRTLTCGQRFTAAEAGEWRVRYIRAIDFMNHSRVLFTAQLQAAGYPTQLTVTAP